MVLAKSSFIKREVILTDEDGDINVVSQKRGDVPSAREEDSISREQDDQTQRPEGHPSHVRLQWALVW
jgi:hypothetical protein